VVRRSTRRSRWTQAEAEAALADAAACGLSLFEYARQQGLADSTLYGWRLRLERRARREAGRSTALAGGSATRSLAFVPVVVADEPVTRDVVVQGDLQAGGSGIEVAVGAVTVRVSRQFCATTLGRVLPVVLGVVRDAASC